MLRLRATMQKSYFRFAGRAAKVWRHAAADGRSGHAVGLRAMKNGAYAFTMTSPPTAQMLSSRRFWLPKRQISSYHL